MLTDREREIYTALAAGNLSLAACLWNSWRQSGHAYVTPSQSAKPDPFIPIFKCAERVLEADKIKISVQDKSFERPLATGVERDFDKKKEA